MRRSLGLLFGVAGVVFALDQWTKRWATDRLADRDPLPVLGEFVRLTYTRNSGVAFGLGAGTNFPFYLFSLLAAGAILALFLRGRIEGRAREVGLALIFGGALGNLVDRISTGLVVDFIEVGVRQWRFPVFNVADSAVTVGVALFALGWTRRPHPAAGVAPAPERNVEEAADAGARGARAAGGGASGPLPGGGAG
ncbi:MAG TPA: signal peptidase II [Candidatus Eisenbacteria bacterium]